MSINNIPKSHIIEGIEPFNDIWFENCFFSALFPILNYFGGSIPAFLNYGICKYYYKPIDSPAIKLDLINCKLNTNYMSLEKHNLGCKTKEVSNDVVNDIRSCIERNMPVILIIDSFFEPIRDDTYMKKHLLHSLNIFGYDDSRKVFNIIEHKYSDSRFFEKRELSYNDIENCYNGLLTGKLAKNTKLTFYNYFKLDNKNLNIGKSVNDSSIFFENILEKKDELYEGLEHIKSFISDFRDIINDQDLLKTNLEVLLNLLTNVIDKKSIERYCILKLFNKELEFSNLMDTSISYWGFIRGILSRYKYSSTYNEKAFQSCLDKLNMIHSNELLWYDNIFSLTLSYKN